MTLNDYTFGNFVCFLREKKGLTQAEVASHLGVTAAAVSKWENGSAKPRVEVLFKLAELLDARPEELMAGRYIEAERLDPEAVRRINERYEYLRRIELHNATGTKLRRVAAWIIDWNLIGLSVILTISVVMMIFAEFEQAAAVMMILMLSYPVLFVLRDLLFRGRSVGKRIMRLVVLNQQTGGAPKRNQLLFRNIFLFIAQVDAVIMLVSGRSVGDFAAHTVVIAKKDLDADRECRAHAEFTEDINRYVKEESTRSATNKKRKVMWICIIIAVVLAFFAAVASITFIFLDQQKDTEEYRLAYTYLVESETFRSYGMEEKDIRLFSYNAYSTNKGGTPYQEVSFGFRIGFFRELYVVCHDEGEGLYVCEECTGFR